MKNIKMRERQKNFKGIEYSYYFEKIKTYKKDIFLV